MTLLKNGLAAFAALSMVAAPVAASAARTEVAVSGNAMGENNDDDEGGIGGGWLIGLLAAALIVGGIIIAADGGSDSPTSGG